MRLESLLNWRKNFFNEALKHHLLNYFCLIVIFFTSRYVNYRIRNLSVILSSVFLFSLSFLTLYSYVKS